MLEIFRRNRFFNSLLLLPYTVLVRIWPVFDVDPPPMAHQGVLTDWLFGGIASNHILSLVTGILLVFLQALMINRLVIRNRLTNELTLFPGLFYILLVSFFPVYNGLSAPLIANTFIIIGLEQLYATQKKSRSAGRIFSSGFWLSMSMLFYFGNIVLLLCGLVGLSMLRTVKAREWLQYLIGYAAPIAIVGMLDYLLHTDASAVSAHFNEQFGALQFDVEWSYWVYGQLFFFGTILLLSIFNSASFHLKKNIHVQKKVSFLFWLLFFLLGAVLVQRGLDVHAWMPVILPMSVFIAMLLIRSKQLLLLEILHFTLLLALIGLNILYLT